MDQFISKVINLTPIADNYFSLSFKWNGSGYPLAGQFLTIKTTELSTPLLRRPFALSAYNKDNKEASIIFQIRGSGTKLLSELQINEELDILGPLGNSFSDYVNVQGNSNKKPVIVAGGIGTGPMLYLTDELKSAGFSPLLIIGCRTKSLIPFTALDNNIETVICTDDGSYGFHGNVVEYMKSRLDISSDAIIYSCGPEPMLKGCHNFAVDSGNICIVALEQMMACGVGACMGCTCEMAGEKKYARVCKDGPVFDSREIKWT